MLSFLKTIRNNWKKSTFGVILLGFGYDYAADKYRTQVFMRAFCEEARQFGEQSLPLTENPRHVTVILNPAAKNGKGKKLYEKFASPLLDLAGLKVSLILTEQEGQARQLMEIMDNTDAVIVAGGDGTLHEVVTGLLRREDKVTACQRFPLGIAPIGKMNNFAKTFYNNSNISETRLLAESTMAVIRELHQKVDVLEIQGETGKPVFAMKSVDCGAFRDTDILIEKYWYFGALKGEFAYLRSAMKRIPGNLKLDVAYTLPCNGCSKCYKPRVSTSPEKAQTRWWQAFIPKIRTTQISDAVPEIDYSKVINEECGNIHNENLDASNFSVIVNKDNQKKAFHVQFSEPLQGRLQFIKEGFSRQTADPKPTLKTLEMRDAQIDIQTEEDVERWFSIDNEKYDKQNMKLTLLPSKVSVYIGKKAT